MYLTKSGITVEITHPAEIKRYKGLGYVEAKVGYPEPEIVEDGVKQKGKDKPAPKPESPKKDGE